MEAIIESMDEFYSDNLGEEVTRGMRESASRGFYLSSKPPYGYHKVKFKDGEKERTRLEVEPNEAGIVTSIFKDILNGKGLTEITKELNQKGIPSPKGKGWGKTGLHSILGNEAYTGIFVWGRNSKRGLDPVRTENACPVIIRRDLFNKVQELMSTRAPKSFHPKRTYSRFLLSGLTFCGHCGKAMTGQDAKGGKYSYYICGTLNKKGAGSCPAHYFSSPNLEEKVINIIKEKILTEENLRKLVEVLNLEMDNTSLAYRDELNAVIANLLDNTQRLGRLYDAVETGKIPLADLAPRIHELKVQSEKLQAQKALIENQLSDRRVELANPEIVAAYVQDMRRVLLESELTERRAFIRSFIKRIEIIDRQAKLAYTTPINGILEEIIGVLPTVQYGGQ